jgi:hypothetical protein
MDGIMKMIHEKMSNFLNTQCFHQNRIHSLFRLVAIFHRKSFLDDVRGTYNGYVTPMWYEALQELLYLIWVGLDATNSKNKWIRFQNKRETTAPRISEQLWVAQTISMLAEAVCYTF